MTFVFKTTQKNIENNLEDMLIRETKIQGENGKAKLLLCKEQQQGANADTQLENLQKVRDTCL